LSPTSIVAHYSSSSHPGEKDAPAGVGNHRGIRAEFGTVDGDAAWRLDQRLRDKKRKTFTCECQLPRALGANVKVVALPKEYERWIRNEARTNAPRADVPEFSNILYDTKLAQNPEKNQPRKFKGGKRRR
jgi:hypothetical protein